MSNHRDRVLTDTETLQALADRVGEDELLEAMMTSGLSHYTARDMIRGTYAKGLRGTTQKALFDSLKKYGLTRERLFKRVTARGEKAS